MTEEVLLEVVTGLPAVPGRATCWEGFVRESWIRREGD